MYICLCKAVSDKAIQHAIEQGHCSKRQIRECLGAGSVCGQCTPQIKSMLDRAYSNPLIMPDPVPA
ncbi:MAG: (2Fe-2S)-binding protein [Methylococcales bacterium]|nr:(2Fe-2S)-binding protein [Methylococcales bacterium]